MQMKKITFLMLFTLISHFSWAQSRTITGTVADSKTKETLPGASIQVKGTSKGAATDMDGNFSIANVSSTDTLVVTYMGYQSQMVPVGTAEKLNIALKSDSKVMEEVVVIGYATVNTRDVTGAVSSVKATALKDIPITDATQALTGRLGGVQVTTGEGGPGANVSIKIRGGGSISQDNSPIYIVDGMQLDNALSTLNPQDIASIDVLKDASATAIYGARGANGVVIITTKSGKPGRTTVTLNSSFGLRKVSSKLDVLSPAEFISWNHEKMLKSFKMPSFQKEYGTTWDTLSVYNDIPAIDWQDKVFGTLAPYANNNVSITGGSEKITYSISLTNNKEQGVMLQSDFDRNLINLKMDATPADKLKVGVNARYMNQQIGGAGTSSNNGSSKSRLKPAIQYQPFATSSTPDSDDYDPEYFGESGLVNPVLLTQAEYQKKHQDAINLNGYASYNLMKNIIFKTSLGYNLNLEKKDNFYSSITSFAILQGAKLPIARIGNKNTSTLNNSNVLTYSKKGIKEHHNIDILLGEETFMTSSNEVKLETRFFPEEISADKALANMSLGDYSNGRVAIQPTTNVGQSALLSYFGRVSYSFKDKYLVSFTGRADGSSKFSEENRWAFFPAGAFSWRFVNEKFWTPPSYLNDGKVRLSFGLSGNNRIDDFLFLPFYSVTSDGYGLNGSVAPAFISKTLANYNLKWETTISRNGGLDLSFLDNRIQFSFDYYYNSVKDLLLEVDIPATSGYTSQIQNVGETSNKGVELQIGATIIEKKDFTWSANFNFSSNSNTVVSIGPSVAGYKLYAADWNNAANMDYIVEVGKPVGQMYGYVTDGFYTVDDFNYDAVNQIYTLKSEVVNAAGVFDKPQPGTMKIKDLDGDGKITADGDKQIIGNANPKFIGGFNNQFFYKGFDMSIFFNWVYGNDIYNANKLEFTSAFSDKTNLTAEMKDRWRNVNSNGELVTDPAALTALNANAKIWSPRTNNRYDLHSWAVEDGSFLRINNVSLGYTLSEKLTKRVKISNVRVYVTVNNLATFTSYTGYDPEANTRTDTPLTPGVDYSAYPRTRTYVAGINVTF